MLLLLCALLFALLVIGYLAAELARVRRLLEHCQPQPARVASVHLTVSREGAPPMQLKDAGERARYQLVEEDAAGNPINGDVGSCEWVIGDEAIATLVADGFTAVVTPTGEVGATTVTATVTIDPGDGSDARVYQGSDAIDVVAGDVAQIVLQGTVEPTDAQPGAAEPAANPEPPA